MSEATTVAVPQTFEQKMLDRIRDSIGDLMPDEELKKILERGVEKALFDPRTTTDHYGRRHDLKESLVDKAVKEFLQKKIDTAVDAWITANPDKMQAAVDAAVKNGIANCVIQAMENRFAGITFDVVQSMQSRGMLPQPASRC